MTAVLYAIARFCVRRRLMVLAIWVLVTVVLVAASHRLGDNTNDNLSLPGTDSQRATDTLSRSFPAQANGTSPVVIHAYKGKLTDQSNAAAVEKATAGLSKEPHVASAVSPLSPQGAAALSKDQKTGYISVTLSVSPGSLSESEAHEIIDGANPAKAAGLEVETGGQLGQKVSKPATESSELIGIIAAMVILAVTFGTAVAMLLPIFNAILALLSTLAIIRMLGHVTTVPSVAPTLATMIGLGVGIDYALFIVTRHFRGMREGLDINESIARATATSGGAVFFAGGTVTIALISLMVAGIPLVNTLGMMSAISVVIAVLAALTLMPATLALTGEHINSLRVRNRHPELHPRQRETLWARWAHRIAKRPVLAGLASLAILIPLMIPLLSLHLGQQDVGALSTSTTARRAYDLISKNFGPGVNGPLIVAVSLGSPAAPSPQAGSGTGSSGATSAASGGTSSSTNPSAASGGTSSSTNPSAASGGTGSSTAQTAQQDPRATDPRLQKLQQDIAHERGVVAVTPIQVDKAGTAAFFNAIAATPPSARSTANLLGRLRMQVIPEAERGTDMRADVGGSTAGYQDLASQISKKLPLQILVVIVLSFALLLLAFRTLAIPPQAAIMNLLSIGASYGVVTALFQYGWGAKSIGLDGPVPIVSYVPLFMFAILFGLSMDYEVFLVSQIKEHVSEGEDNTGSVVAGLVTSARVITAAALIMVFVFGSFLLNGDPTIKQFGVGLAVAVILDATVVRCLLVPTLMVLMGKVNWWLPRWLDKILPQLSIEGAEFFEKLDSHRAAPEPTTGGAPVAPAG